MLGHLNADTKKAFFETGEFIRQLLHKHASGNPVKIRDGCATVTGYKLSRPLEVPGRRERGHARSQDIGLLVLVVVRAGRWFRFAQADFSVKRRMRPALPLFGRIS